MGFGDAARLTNDSVEILVVPSIQRILSYGYIDGPNMLWDNSEAARGEPAHAWRNWGGDKVWPWPHSRWEQWVGRMFPPPPGLDRAARVEMLGERALRMTGPVDKGLGMRVVRDIRLAPTGSRATITSMLEKVTGEPMDAGVWTISQVADRDEVYCLLPDGASEPFIKCFGSGGWTCRDLQGRTACLGRPLPDGGKIGVDGCGLAVVDGDCLMVQWPIADSGDVTKIEQGERVQFYAHGRLTGEKPDPAGYLELEFSSEVMRLEPGQSASMTVAWELDRLDGVEPTQLGLAIDEISRGMMGES
jgi:hypothetical protein